jgi:hypothetical protein
MRRPNADLQFVLFWVDYARVSQGAWLSNKSLGLKSRLLIELNADLSQPESNLSELEFRRRRNLSLSLIETAVELMSQWFDILVLIIGNILGSN